MRCPDCGDPVRKGESACPCGWQQAGGKRTPTTNRVFPCDYCGRALFYPSKSTGKPSSNHLVGRSHRGGYVCAECYGNPPNEEQGYREVAAQAFDENHADDMWGVLIRASQDTTGKEAGIAHMATLKVEARKAGGLTKELPYDPSERVERQSDLDWYQSKTEGACAKRGHLWSQPKPNLERQHLYCQRCGDKSALMKTEAA